MSFDPTDFTDSRDSTDFTDLTDSTDPTDYCDSSVTSVRSVKSVESVLSVEYLAPQPSLLGFSLRKINFVENQTRMQWNFSESDYWPESWPYRVP